MFNNPRLQKEQREVKFLPKTFKEWNTATRTMLFVFKDRFWQDHLLYHPYR